MREAKYIIGELSKNGKYEFKYRTKELDNAIRNGFEPLIAFANINEVYESYDMFPAFSSRLSNKRRKYVKEILAKYELEKYDAFELRISVTCVVVILFSFRLLKKHLTT